MNPVAARIGQIAHRLAAFEAPAAARPATAFATVLEGATGRAGAAFDRSIAPGTIGSMLAAAAGGTAVPIDGRFGALPLGAIGGGGAPATDLTLSGDTESRRQALAPVFAQAGARYGVDPALLEAVAWTESDFRPDVVSHAGAIGLMQIMPGTAAGLGVDPRDPVQAIDGAARYLRDALDRFGDVRLALAAYNAGPGAVASHGGIPPYPETTAYVAKVMDRYESLRGTTP
jgi:peptidoglycan DL-endopeptidase CwlO